MRRYTFKNTGRVKSIYKKAKETKAGPMPEERFWGRAARLEHVNVKNHKKHK